MADVDKSRAEAQRLLTYQQADRYIEYHLLSGKRIAIPNDICIMRFKPAWILKLFPFIAYDCTCNFMENGVAILWKNYLQLFSKSTCKKHGNPLKSRLTSLLSILHTPHGSF